jgi:leader peptidase (prepilin peptidase)/N-methyltransferase
LETLITVWIAVLGLCVGSFLNVVIARLPEDDELDSDALPAWKSTLMFSFRAYRRLAWPGSRCPRCGKSLPWYENIPVVSWLVLRGRCSGCKTPISPRYILVELLTGALFVASTARFSFDWALVSALTFLTFLIPLIFIDASLWILPFELTLPGIAGGLLLALPQGHATWVSAVWGAVFGFILFRGLEVLGWLWTSRTFVDATGKKQRRGLEALGMGDKYLLAMIGAQLGWRSILGVVLLASVQGSIVGVARMLATGRAGPSAPNTVSDTADEDPEPPRFPFSPEFLKPGLAWWQRVLWVPYTVFIQDIPDSPEVDATTGEMPEWEPQANSIPFGPWLGLAGIEVLLAGPWVVQLAMHSPFRLFAEIVFWR